MASHTPVTVWQSLAFELTLNILSHELREMSETFIKQLDQDVTLHKI